MRVLLGLSALVLTFAILTRCAPLVALLPQGLETVVPLAVGAALGLLGVLERHAVRATVGPLWMQLPRPLSLSLALGVSYFTTLFAQEFGVSLGPVDPSFPAALPAATAIAWFAMFTLGFCGVGMMAAPALLVPLLRVVTAPVAKVPFVPQAGVGAALGSLFALALLAGLRTPLVEGLVKQGQAFFSANATAGTLVLIAIGVVPGLLPQRKTAAPPEPAEE